MAPVVKTPAPAPGHPNPYNRPVVPLRVPDQYSFLSDGDQDTILNSLTLAQWKFVQEYMVDFDHERAYRAVYSATKNARQLGRKLLKDIKIQAAISEYLRQYGERLSIKKDTIVGALFQIAVDPDAKDSDKIKAWETIAKLVGVIGGEGETDKTRVPTVHVNITGPSQAIIQSGENRADFKFPDAPIVDVEVDDPDA